MPIALYRIDDRLIHGQVVVGWGQPLELGFIVLVDDEVASSEWEQELYRMGVPPEMSVQFYTVIDAAAQLAELQQRPEPGIVLVGDIGTMRRLVDHADGRIRAVNVGGVHYSPGRVQRLRFVFLTPAEEQGLRDIADLGVEVSAQDVPSARPVPLGELLASTTGA
ncbi:PTS system mannose/fructose/N-acetylgalactosamine-transporter subunit IIB [Gemmatimonas sp.]|jgi:mannose/fructose/N-acetylgalactosamine-specific phosphotransferase system component IIB|uniref:PTS system mannose/fructose/N-acetylgalactosamine-transporter subunit IIB n=1 Tax=Gemmatimonas sp. TaxID=1962908 RepID=UPI0037BF238A